MTNAGIILFSVVITGLVAFRVWKAKKPSYLELEALWVKSINARDPARSAELRTRLERMRGGPNVDLSAEFPSKLDGPVRILISLIVLCCALFIIMSHRYDTEQQKWAFGVIGTILGYWLKN